MNKKITVAIAEDQLLFRKGIIGIINSFLHAEVAFECENGRVLIDVLNKINPLPDVILMDLKMPEIDGIEATKIIREKYPLIKIIILTSYNDKRFILHLIESGAHGYLLKDTEPYDLEKAILAVSNEGYYFMPEIMDVILHNKVQPNTVPKLNEKQDLLSEREIEIIQLICKEKTAVEIGELLFISPRTVEGHRNRILEKTGCKNIAGLVVYALTENIFKPPF